MHICKWDDNPFLLTILNRRVISIHASLGLRCFEKDCTFTHSGVEDLEMRKLIFKQFNKQFKAIQMRKKIEREINTVKTSKVNWADM